MCTLFDLETDLESKRLEGNKTVSCYNIATKTQKSVKLNLINIGIMVRSLFALGIISQS